MFCSTFLVLFVAAHESEDTQIMLLFYLGVSRSLEHAKCKNK